MIAFGFEVFDLDHQCFNVIDLLVDDLRKPIALGKATIEASIKSF